MVPPIDTSRARKCLKCGTVKEPAEFKTARKCIECVDAAIAADAEAYRVANLPAGTIMTAEDIIAAPWTITELKEKKEIRQGFVKLMDLSPDFLNGVVAATTDAKIIDAASRTAHKQKSKESISFCSVPWCLKHLGLKQCSKCPPEDNVRRLEDFGTADGKTGQLRGGCRACERGVNAAQRVVNIQVRDEKAATGETRLCVGPCGEIKCVSKFDENRNTCNSCRNKERESKGQDNAIRFPDKYRMCVGCQCSHTIEEFEGDSAVCKKRHASITAQLRNSKKSAARRGKEWKLSDAEATAIFSLPCFYSKIYEPEVHPSGIDRLDNTVGYVVGNCVPCHRVVNMMKGDMTPGEFHCALTDVVERDRASTLLKARYDNAIKMKMTCKLSFEELCATIVANTAWVMA